MGVGAQLFFELEAEAECGACILVLQHLPGLGHTGIQVSFVPDFKICELVVRGQERMRLPRSFRLRHLVQPFPLGAGLDVILVDLLAVRPDNREHRAVAEVVWDGEHAPAGLFLVVLHPLPQVDRVVSSKRRIDREWNNHAGFVAVVTEDHIPVLVVPA